MEKIKRHSFLFSGNKEFCSGCGACKYVCSKKAIEMYEDSEGFLYPQIDKSKCVDCGLCDSTCPMNPTNSRPLCESRCFAVWPKVHDYKLVQSCATAGVCTSISQNVLKKGGVVYGCWLDEEINIAKHIRVTSVEEQVRLRNSKYIQSHLGNSFELVKKDLQGGKQVLFIGTSCQIAGLKAFLRKDWGNLLTIDLICHGVASYKIYQKERAFWEKLYNGKIENFRFRGKGIFPYIVGGLVNFDVKMKFVKFHVNVPAKYSPMYNAYLGLENGGKCLTLRQSCYNCDYHNMNRVSDITIGDYHYASQHINVSCAMRQFGLSLVLANTPKGDDILGEILGRFNVVELRKEQAAVQPALMGTIYPIPPQRKIIYENIDKMPYEELVEKFIFSRKVFQKRQLYVMKYLLKYYILVVYVFLFKRNKR